MKKLTKSELFDLMYDSKEVVYGVIVYREDNWEERYSLASRSYIFSSEQKRFNPNAISNSIWADSLDGSDTGVRLDVYTDWKVDYCYLADKDGNPLDK